MERKNRSYEQELDARFEAAKERILSAVSEWSLRGEGRAYYVSPCGNDEADGLSPETAWRSVSRVNDTPFAEGSAVLFERGGVWRHQGSLRIQAGVTYSAYGEGDKPLFANDADASAPSDWVNVGKDLWVYDGAYSSALVEGFPNDETLAGSYLTSIDHGDARFVDHPRNDDVGNVILDGGKRWGVKITKTTENKSVALGTVWNGAEDRDFPSVPFHDERDLTVEGTFYHNPKTSRLYLCCPENPAKCYHGVKLVIRGYGVGGNALSQGKGVQGTTLDNLAIKYFGAHGVSVGRATDFTIRNCEIGWIGGSIQTYDFGGRDYPTRFGEGIQNWGVCNGYYIQNSWVYQIYDGAISSQRSIVENMDPLIMRDIRVTDCLLEYNTASVEMWMNPTANQSKHPELFGFEGMRVTGNLFRNIGYGFGNTRPGTAIFEDTAFAVTIGDGYQGEPGIGIRDCVFTENAMWRTRRFFLSGLYWSMTRGHRLSGNTFLSDYGSIFAQLPTDFDHLKEWGYSHYLYTDEVIDALTERGIVGKNDFYYLDPAERS